MEDCTICLCPTARTRQTRVLACGHKFHKQCINQWTQETCPTCRFNFSKPEYKVTITIENKKNHERIVLENQSLDTNVLQQLGINENSNFSTVQLEMSTYSLEELHEIMTDFGILGSVDINSLVFNTE